jgi:hypothetical protein
MADSADDRIRIVTPARVRRLVPRSRFARTDAVGASRKE